MNKILIFGLLFFQSYLHADEPTFYEVDPSALANIKVIEKIHEDGIQVDWIESSITLDLRDGSALDKVKIDYRNNTSHYSASHWIFGTTNVLKVYGAKGLKREWQGGNFGNVHVNVFIPTSFSGGNISKLNLMLHRAISIAVYNVIKRVFREEEIANPNFSKKSDKVKLKWINDVMVNGKKICGIKPDDFFDSDFFVSYQFSVNINMPKDELDRVDQPATSLAVECGHAFDHRKIARDILIELIHIMNRYRYDLERLDQLFSSKMCFVGEPIVVYDAIPGQNVSGILESVSGGRLYVRQASGDLKVIHPGTGILRKLPQ